MGCINRPKLAKEEIEKTHINTHMHPCMHTNKGDLDSESINSWGHLAERQK